MSFGHRRDGPPPTISRGMFSSFFFFFVFIRLENRFQFKRSFVRWRQTVHSVRCVVVINRYEITRVRKRTCDYVIYCIRDLRVTIFVRLDRMKINTISYYILLGLQALPLNSRSTWFSSWRLSIFVRVSFVFICVLFARPIQRTLPWKVSTHSYNQFNMQIWFCGILFFQQKCLL